MSEAEAGSFYRRRAGGVELFVRLTPKSARDAIEGAEAGADGRSYLRARVRAVPEKGKANEALERLVAASLDVPAGGVSVVAGGTARLKTMRVKGDAEAIEARLAALVGSWKKG